MVRQIRDRSIVEQIVVRSNDGIHEERTEGDDLMMIEGRIEEEGKQNGAAAEEDEG